MRISIMKPDDAFVEMVKKIEENDKSHRITPRQLVNYFDYKKRTTGNCARINEYLNKNNLETDPDYTKGWMDKKITIRHKAKNKGKKDVDNNPSPTIERDEAKDCLDSYSKVLDIWKVMNDNYFKRVQLFMSIIQVGLFITALKFVSSPIISVKTIILLILLSVMGLTSAIIWKGLDKKQIQYLEFCRRTLRNIESRLGQLKVPLEYFVTESLVFHSYRDCGLLHSATTNTNDSKSCWVKFNWSKEEYPKPDDKDCELHSIKNVSGGMVSFEKKITYGAMAVWEVIFFFASLYLGFLIYSK